MVALVYHPAYDPYGCVLRSVQFLTASDQALFAEQLRLFDFLLLFPEFISTFRLSPSTRSRFKRTSFRPRFRYEERPPAKRLFSEMELSFEAALQTLKTKEIIVSTDINTDIFLLNRKAVPEGLDALVAKRNVIEAELIEFLIHLNSSFSFFGPDGLKARSGLMEFRYDIV